MKYVTFKGAHVYTCLAIMLEDFRINKTDLDIALEMRMPYLFSQKDISKTKVAFTAGTRLQDKVWYDLFLNRYQLEFIKEHLTRLQTMTMLQNLGKFKRKALLSLLIEKKRYDVVFSHYDTFHHTYQFIIPETVDAKVYHYADFNEETLLKHLEDHVDIGFINPSEEVNYTMIDAIRDTLKTLDHYLSYVQDFCQMKHTKKRQLEAFDMVFRSFIVDLREILKLKGEEELYQLIRRLSHQYVDYIKNEDERFMIPLKDEFTHAISVYKTFVEDYYKRIEHTLKA